LQEKSVVRAIADNVAAHPEKTIFRFLDRGETESCAYSYAALDGMARRVAAGLLDRRLGDAAVLLVFEPGEEFVVALLGCLYAGVVAIPAPAPRKGASLERLEGVAKNSGAAVMVCGEAIKAQIGAGDGTALGAMSAITLGELAAAPPLAACPGLDRASDAPILVQYTSGSTLSPRGVVLDSACIAANVAFACRGIGFGTDGEETFVNWMPHYHDMGLIGNLLLPLAMGHESIHLSPIAFVQSPLRWLQAISRYRGTASGGPPLAYDACVARIADEEIDRLDLSSWRIGFCGAEPVFANTLDAFRSRFARAGLDPDAVFCVYGMAETAVYAGGSPPPPVERRTALPTENGKVAREPCFLDAETRDSLHVVSAAGAVLPDGEEGEIWISHRSVASGYLGDADATAATFGHRLSPDDGRLYLRTGDLGTIRDDVLVVTGRIKDVLIRNGVNFAASDIERIAATGRTAIDPNSCAAFQSAEESAPIVLLLEKRRGLWDAGAEEGLIRDIRAGVMAGVGLALDDVAFVEPGFLPRTTSGKIQRRRACALWQGAGR
jgi:acyl-CoA synthetase (AMP-forming)/AMP-acid ligase II